jgi:xanthine/CO dehydrogenase XdhC/CoxF family maturation factor
LRVSISLQRLLPLFERELLAGCPMVMATVLRTAGPTYSKPGALMLICGSGEYAGVLTGGCLEGDLSGRSRAVLSGGSAMIATYDMRGPDDLLFGLGSGCEGSIDILLQRLDAPSGWQPMARMAQAWREQRALPLALVGRSGDARWPSGSGLFADDGLVFGATGADRASSAQLRALAEQCGAQKSSQFLSQALPDIDLLALYQAPPSQILLLGAGPDAQPVAELAAFLGWQITVIDHRSHYARAARFAGAKAVLDSGAPGLSELLRGVHAPFDSAIIMSHHFATDLAYLRIVAQTEIPYVGLLGPVARRERLMTELGPLAAPLRSRLRAPVGLDLGAASPESIALAIVAEIQGTLAGCESMGPMSRKQKPL